MVMKDTARKKQMFSLIDQYFEAPKGKSQKQFCRENGIQYSTFLYWMKVYRENKSQKPSFLPLEVIASDSDGAENREKQKPRVEVEFSEGFTLRIY